MRCIKGAIVKLIVVLTALFAIGGWAALGQGVEIIITVFKGFFPVFFDVAKSSAQDYFTSPYFIVGVIMSLASACGIWIGAKGGRVLFVIVSIMCEVISLASIVSNVL